MPWRYRQESLVFFIAMVRMLATLYILCVYMIYVSVIGSFSTATCTTCKHRVPIDAIKEKIMSEVSSLCTSKSC